MKITYVVPLYLPHLGGIGNHVAALATYMANRGHEVTVITQLEVPPTAKSETVELVTIKRFSSYMRFKGKGISPALIQSVHQLDETDADIVHVHDVHGATTLGVLAVMQHPRMVLTPHYLGASDQLLIKSLHHVYDPPLKRALHKASKIICASDAESQLMQLNLGVKPDCVVVIPNGVYVDAFRTAQPADASGDIVFVAARLEEYKQTMLVVQAMAHLPQSYRLIVAGSGPQLEALKTTAFDLGVSDRVDFIGTVGFDEIAKWYRRANVFVAMSRRECFGMTLAESLAARCPVIASDIPAHREIIEGAHWNATHLISPSSSAHSLAAAITQMTNVSPDKLDPHVTSWSEVGDATVELYESLLSLDRAMQ